MHTIAKNVSLFKLVLSLCMIVTTETEAAAHNQRRRPKKLSAKKLEFWQQLNKQNRDEGDLLSEQAQKHLTYSISHTPVDHSRLPLPDHFNPNLVPGQQGAPQQKLQAPAYFDPNQVAAQQQQDAQRQRDYAELARIVHAVQQRNLASMQQEPQRAQRLAPAPQNIAIKCPRCMLNNPLNTNKCIYCYAQLLLNVNEYQQAQLPRLKRNRMKAHRDQQ